jgi:hypothetical protein
MKIYDMIEGKWLKDEKKVEKKKEKEKRKELELALRLAKHGEKNT